MQRWCKYIEQPTNSENWGLGLKGVPIEDDVTIAALLLLVQPRVPGAKLFLRQDGMLVDFTDLNDPLPTGDLFVKAELPSGVDGNRWRWWWVVRFVCWTGQ